MTPLKLDAEDEQDMRNFQFPSLRVPDLHVSSEEEMEEIAHRANVKKRNQVNQAR